MARIAGSDITASPSQLFRSTNTFDIEDGLKATNFQNSKSGIKCLLLCEAANPGQCHLIWPRDGNAAALVGRTPWSARDALVPHSAQRYQSLAGRKRPTGASSPEGTPWSWGLPHQFVQMFGSGKNKCPWPILASQIG